MERRGEGAAARAAERAQNAFQRLQQKTYSESRAVEVDRKNEALDRRVEGLRTILGYALQKDSYVDLDGFKQQPELPPFQPGSLGYPLEPPNESAFLPLPLPFWQGLVPGARKKRSLRAEQARRRFSDAFESFVASEAKRKTDLAKARAGYEQQLAAIRTTTEDHNTSIDTLKAAFTGGDVHAIAQYFLVVLNASRYPQGFTANPRVAYVKESKQLVLEYEFPTFEIVPTTGVYKYVKAKDEIVESPRPASQRKAIYSEIVSQTTLRTLHELFTADRTNFLESVVFNGYVNSIDKGTGHRVRPCIITVRADKEAFSKLDLTKVDATLCLKALSASVSRSPSELVAVRPVIEFSMVDPRFIEESDVLSNLDRRPNLMELSPRDFESLITNLFGKMGLEMRQTQASRDGGVDCVAFDSRPIFGGKVVIQAKRYKNTVGVSAVRDLFGTMQNEGASKGILITTSGYGKASFEFANNKPMELLSGSNLLYLLKQHAGMDAKIEPPNEWVDPRADVGE